VDFDRFAYLTQALAFVSGQPLTKACDLGWHPAATLWLCLR